MNPERGEFMNPERMLWHLHHTVVRRVVDVKNSGNVVVIVVGWQIFGV